MVITDAIGLLISRLSFPMVGGKSGSDGRDKLAESCSFFKNGSNNLSTYIDQLTELEKITDRTNNV